MDDNGGLKWWIVLCLMAAWIIVFFIVMKGIQSSGKVSRGCVNFHSYLMSATIPLGCVLHIALPILCVDNIFHSGHHA